MTTESLKISNAVVGSNFVVGSISWPGDLLFMYSACPFLVTFTRLEPDTVTLRVTNRSTGDAFEETRVMYKSQVAFEIRSILQYLAPDVTAVLTDQRGAVPSSMPYAVELLAGSAIIWSRSFDVVFGVLNARESYCDTTTWSLAPSATRRVWTNYPFTVRTQINKNDEMYILSNDNRVFYIEHDSSAGSRVYETNLMRTLLEAQVGSALLTQLQTGQPCEVGLSNYYSIDSRGTQNISSRPLSLRLIPDLTPRNASGVTYLRWLQRDGSIGYWLFKNGEMLTSVETRNTFQRYYATPNAPTIKSGASGDFVHYESNPQKADYTEAQVLNLGAQIYNRDDYRYLSGLFCSPVVERLIPDGSEGWERVTILPSSQSINLKRDTPMTKILELAIELPHRDTITL